MIGKKINQLATELAPTTTDLTIIGDPISGVSKKITLAQLGAIFSGAVSFYDDLASFPATGDINVIYCAKDTKKLYLWSGSAYVEVFPSQALLDTYQLRSEKGNANGYASLDSGGKVPISQLPSSIMEYKGMWNAATNTPTLANGTGDTGDVYICNVAGTVNFGAGPITFAVGDYTIYSGSIWQRSSGAVGTVTSVAASITGDAIGITGSPVTTSGTLALAFAGTSSQYINGAGNLTTFPTLTGYVPYTGATANVDLGTHTLSAKDLVINHSSGSGVAASITKGGAGEALTVVKSSGSGNAASITGGVTLLDELHLNTDLADTYIASASNWNAAYNDKINSAAVTGTTTKTLTLTQQDGGTITASWTDDNTDAVTSVFGRTGAVVAVSGDYNTSQVTENTNLYYTEARVNANTNVAANTAARHNAVTLGTANGLSLSTQVLSLALASGSTTGALSSTDWTTFNNKQSALTNPVTGTGTTNYLPKFTGTSTIGNSIMSESGSVISVAGSITAVNSNGRITLANGNTSSGNKIQSFNAAGNADGYLAFEGYTKEYGRFDTSGNLGLGVTPSAWNSGYKVMDVSAWGSIAGEFGTQGTISLVSNCFANSTGYNNWTYVNTAPATRYKQYNGEHQWFNAPSGTAGNAISFTQAMTLNALGNLAIGTTSILGSSVERSIHLSAPTNQYATLYLTNSANTLKGIFAIADPTSSIFVGSQSNHAFSIITNDTPRLTIASTGAATFSNSFTTSDTSAIFLSPSLGTNQTVFLQLGKNIADTYNSGEMSFKFVASGSSSNMVSLGFYGAGQKLNVLGNGNVGIGTTSPTALLHIEKASQDNILAVIGQSGYEGALFLSGAGSGKDANIVVGNGRNLEFHTSSSTTPVVDGTERMRITSGGNVGIGTTPDTNYILDVLASKDVRFKGATSYMTLVLDNSSTTGGGGIYFRNNGTNGGGIGNSGWWFGDTSNDLLLVATSGKNIRFHTNDSTTEKMRITSGGNVEINTGSIKTGEPDTGYGRAAVKIGARNTGQAFDSGGHLPVNIDGTIYYINLYSSLP